MRTKKLPLTQVFVDYESWFWGMYNTGGVPNLQAFVEEIKLRGRIEQIHFFGDFTRPEMEQQRNRLRTITNNIIDCTNKETMKDYTDFIMLDHIYKTAIMRPDVEQYVIVTGDGHFHSVIAYLKTFLDKMVGVYGVTGTMSMQLKESSSWYVEFAPAANKEDGRDLWGRVLKNLRFTESTGAIPCFSKTIEVGAKLFSVDKALVGVALKQMIDAGYITQEYKPTPNSGTIKALIPNWDRIYREGLLESEPDKAAA